MGKNGIVLDPGSSYEPIGELLGLLWEENQQQAIQTDTRTVIGSVLMLCLNLAPGITQESLGSKVASGQWFGMTKDLGLLDFLSKVRGRRGGGVP